MAAADKPLKEGQLHIKQNRVVKKWKRCYMVLYPDSQFGVARLEIYDWKDGTLTGEKIYARRAADRKVIRLSECIHVAPAPTENGHKENMAAFIIETSDKTMVLSTERLQCEEWVQRLSEIAFMGKVDGSQDKGSEASDGVTSLEMAINNIYFSRKEVSEYRVTVQRTEAAERCSLRGTYILNADDECLMLKDPSTMKVLYSWPYKLLRRYGRDKVMFSFEAGRRCQSGPGNFTFETTQGHDIFQKVEGSIRAQQGSENRLSCPILDTENPSDNTSLGSDSGGSDTQVRKDMEEKSLKGRALPNLPSTKPVQPQHLLDHSSLSAIPGKTNTPPRSPLSRSLSYQSGENEHLMVYSEPKDSVKGVNPHFDPLYSDPVDSVAGQGVRPHKDKSAASPLYSDLYEHVGYEVVGGGVGAPSMGLPKLPRGGEEHIYDEPEGMAQSSTPLQLYSEVQTEAGAWKKQANDDKVGYEFPYNPNSDDYSVPNFLGKPSQPRNKPGTKPIPAPKPQAKLIPKPPGKEDDFEKVLVVAHCSQANRNNNNGNTQPIYSQVIKTVTVETKLKMMPPLPPKPQSTPPLPVMGKPLPSLSASNKPQPGTSPNKSQFAKSPITHEDVDNMTSVLASGTFQLPQASEKVPGDLIYEELGVL
ncbi:docking protein 1-like isoform X1 [Bufo gargarizans]|uniref:docking protein 1-like isoform X1 n=1 Tax=Bufo gargarizans TaxID=30331 RepID=UPI001CF48048|nr:docking protein 1-like isoform X1 [Bufo gargarizans]